MKMGDEKVEVHNEANFPSAKELSARMFKGVQAIRESVKELVIDGLYTDGGHHKQWFLWEIAKELSLTDDIKGECKKRDYEPEEGIAP